MKRPTLSVVVTNYDHAKYLPEAIEAILSQSYRAYEFIISDPASTDNSVEIIEKYAEREPHQISS